MPDRPRIISPRLNTSVAHRERVFVGLPPGIGSRVFLYVTGGGKWWTQQSPTRSTDGVWEAECAFGDHDSYGNTFKVIAIAMDAPPAGNAKSYEQLPDGNRSEEIAVVRMTRGDGKRTWFDLLNHNLVSGVAGWVLGLISSLAVRH